MHPRGGAAALSGETPEWGARARDAGQPARSRPRSASRQRPLVTWGHLPRGVVFLDDLRRYPAALADLQPLGFGPVPEAQLHYWWVGTAGPGVAGSDGLSELGERSREPQMSSGFGS